MEHEHTPKTPVVAMLARHSISLAVNMCCLQVKYLRVQLQEVEKMLEFQGEHAFGTAK